MQLFIGYMIFLTFTIGLLIWVFLIKTELNKKIKTVVSLVILCLTLILSIIFMSFLPFKWMNVIYYISLLLGFIILVMVVYIIVSSITKFIQRKRGEQVEDVKLSTIVQQSKQKVTASFNKSKNNNKPKPQKQNKSNNNKKATDKNKKTSNNQKQQQAKDKQLKQVTPVANKKKVKQRKAASQNKKQVPMEKKTVKPKDKKPQNRRMEDYEPPRQSQVSQIEKPTKPNFKEYNRKKK